MDERQTMREILNDALNKIHMDHGVDIELVRCETSKCVNGEITHREIRFEGEATK